MSQSGGRWSRQKPVLRSQCVERSPRGQTRPAPEAAGSALYRSPLRRSSWLECPPRCSDPRPIPLPTAVASPNSGHAACGRERRGGAGCPCDPPVHGLAGSASRSRPGGFRRWTRCRRTRCASFCHPVRIDHVGGLGSPHSNCRRSGWRARTGSSSLQTRRPGRFLQKMGDWDWLSLPD